MPNAYFMTGTDTHVGKTRIACGLLAAAKQRQWQTLAVKPVATGGTQTAQGWQNEDAQALRAAMTIALTYDEINPVALAPPIAPHIAAYHARQPITVSALAKHCRRVLARPYDFAVIEGAGGWRVPLNEQETMADLARQLALPVILVVAMRLGCLNHALLTVEAMQADGIKLAGWVANQVTAEMAYLADNLRTLQHRIAAPCFGVVPFLTSPDDATIARYLPMTDVVLT